MKTLYKSRVHFVDSYLLNPTNPITVNLIGAGGTGSHMLHVLARTNFALTTLGMAGLQVNVFDPDIVETPNLGRAELNENYIGLNKAVALVAHINWSYGTNWKAVPETFQTQQFCTVSENCSANLTICCVDTVKARFAIAEILSSINKGSHYKRDKPMYYIDFGNNKYTGQVMLSTVGIIDQPHSEKFMPVNYLPPITEEYADLLNSAKPEPDASSCSLLESLNKQSLFINSSLANLGGALIDQMLQGVLHYRGFFLNLENFKCEPIAV